MPTSTLRNSLLLSLALLCSAPAVVRAQSGPTSVAVLRLQADLPEQPHADLVTDTLKHLLAEVPKLEVLDRTDVMVSDLLLVYGCDVESADCLRQVAEGFGTRQVLFGTVEPFGDELLVRLKVYDGALAALRPVYSRRIPRAVLSETLQGDLTDLVSGTLWQLPSYLSLQVPGVAEASVFVDGAPVGLAPLDRWKVQPGERVVRVEAAAHAPWQKTMTFKEGTPVALEITLPRTQETVDTSQPAAPSSETTPSSESPRRVGQRVYQPPTSAWVALIVGGVALAGGGITGILTIEKTRAFEREDRQAQADRLRHETENLALTTNVLLGAGAAGLLTAAVLFTFMGDMVVLDDASLSMSASPVRGGATMAFELRF